MLMVQRRTEKDLQEEKIKKLEEFLNNKRKT